MAEQPRGMGGLPDRNLAAVRATVELGARKKLESHNEALVRGLLARLENIASKHEIDLKSVGKRGLRDVLADMSVRMATHLRPEPILADRLKALQLRVVELGKKQKAEDFEDELAAIADELDILEKNGGRPEESWLN